MTRYEYDKSLRDKLVLPDHHRDLLDVLTSDINDYVDDIIEGKSAGNIIMCKGHWGVGKTLTAEVYAELIERPLLAVHSGQLGTSASSIEKTLKNVFSQAKRWNAVLLLDEADVFVSKRGGNVEHNAIVAEFLRSMEYFDGLMFMTTNRPDDIDEAILSRCAAIIDYTLPDKAHLTKIWKVMNEQFKSKLSDEMIDKLVAKYPDISPRDVKHLLRLAIRVSVKMEEPLDMEMFRRCAMFRALDTHHQESD
jgi:SpoVK/Ycf46/Vps4 family AAA+-type ATPase